MSERVCMVCMLPPSAHSYEVSHMCCHTHEEGVRTSAPNIVLGHYRILVDTWDIIICMPQRLRNRACTVFVFPILFFPASHTLRF